MLQKKWVFTTWKMNSTNVVPLFTELACYRKLGIHNIEEEQN